MKRSSLQFLYFWLGSHLLSIPFSSPPSLSYPLLTTIPFINLDPTCSFMLTILIFCSSLSLSLFFIFFLSIHYYFLFLWLELPIYNHVLCHSSVIGSLLTWFDPLVYFNHRSFFLSSPYLFFNCRNLTIECFVSLIVWNIIEWNLILRKWNELKPEAIKISSSNEQT